jgi:hypothetical protein
MGIKASRYKNIKGDRHGRLWLFSPFVHLLYSHLYCEFNPVSGIRCGEAAIHILLDDYF